ncbi:hypothetical protein [Acidisoma sp. C75]
MSTKRPTGDVATALAVLGGMTVLGGLALAMKQPPPPPPRMRRRALLSRASQGPLPVPPVDRGTIIRSARRLNRAAGTLALSVLADSAVEHYRGSFHNKAMVAPIVTSAFSLLVSTHGHFDKRRGAHWLRDTAYAAAGLTGLVGTGFHLYNVGSRPGGVSWQNLFYGAPLGAPAALILSGMLGFLSERLRNNPTDEAPTILGLPAGRILGLLTSLGLCGTVGEAGLLHFRGAYHNPAMFLPVTAPPAAAVLLASASLSKAGEPKPVARWWLRFTALLGLLGSAFHAVGVGRNMGGWRNWRQNVVDGPPLPAPPSFTGLALAGLAALGLMEDRPDV